LSYADDENWKCPVVALKQVCFKDKSLWLQYVYVGRTKYYNLDEKIFFLGSKIVSNKEGFGNCTFGNVE